jgi:hypothetical protein
MLKGINNKISGRKKSKLKLTPGENIRDAIIKAGIKTAEESAYVAGNNTDKLVNISENLGKLSENLVKLSEKLGGVADRGTGLVGGTESATAFGKIAFKTTKDMARGDTLCTGLCVVSGTCETIALCCSTIKVIPFRGRIYVGAKIVSKGCISFRNACVGEGC